MAQLKHEEERSAPGLSSTSVTPRDWTTQPRLYYPAYQSTTFRHPTKAPVSLSPTLSELTAPLLRAPDSGVESDLTSNARIDGEPLGERIVVSGRLLDDNGRPIANSLIEIWQANAAGRYAQSEDQHDAPLDPNFLGAGRCTTDENGRYSFMTVKPGAYPWANHHNGWRPAHIHLSLFGPCFASRLITQFYFPGDPLLDVDPIFNSTPKAVRHRLVSRFSAQTTVPNKALGYEFDIVLRGAQATPLEC